MSRRGRRPIVVAALVLGLTLVLAGCGDSQEAAGLARAAVRNFEHAGSVTVAARFREGVIPVALRETVSRSGVASSSGTFDGLPVSFVSDPISTFVEGTGYWAWEQLSGGQSWAGLGSTRVETSSDGPATAAFRRPATLTGLVAQLDADRPNLSRAFVDIGGAARLLQLQDGSARYFVTAGNPHRLFAVRDDASRAGATLLGPSTFSLAYGSQMPESVPPAGAYVNAENPSNLPAQYQITGYTRQVTIEKLAGAPVGQSVVTLTAYEWPALEIRERP